MTDKLFAVDDKGMPRVVSALEPDHDIRLFRQKIDDLALAFVPPLGPYNHDIGHRLLLRIFSF